MDMSEAATFNGEQRGFCFVFETGLVKKIRTNTIFHLVGKIVKFGDLDTRSLKLKPK